MGVSDSTVETYFGFECFTALPVCSSQHGSAMIKSYLVLPKTYLALLQIQGKHKEIRFCFIHVPKKQLMFEVCLWML